MHRRLVLAILLILAAASATAGTSALPELKDLYFGEAVYYALQEDWFEAIARLDTELAQHYGLDEPERDTLYYHIHQARFAVGDFELAYRMHQRAGRAIKAVIEGNVNEAVRNEAIFRLARMYFQKDQPADALYAVERIRGASRRIFETIWPFCAPRSSWPTAAIPKPCVSCKGLQDAKVLEGFSTYNLGIALIKDGRNSEGRRYLDRTGHIR